MESSLLPATYDPNRTADGKFVKGNKLRSGTQNEVSKRFAELRSLWYDANSADDMRAVKAELIGLCKTCPVPDVKLKAIVYYLDRMMGRPKETVELDVTAHAKPMPLPDLTPEEVAVLNKVISRTQDDDVADADVVPAKATG